MNTPQWTLLLFGMTGDLSRHKIIPALYGLIRKNAPIGLIIGTGREEVSVAEILEPARAFIDNFDENTWRQFVELIRYQPLSADKSADYDALAKLCNDEQQKRGLTNSPRLVYLAVPADFFCTITENLVKANVILPHHPEHRIAYEKPFGWSLASAMSINQCVKKFLAETQVFRIDHYLAKDFVSNLLLTRYSNTLFKAVWNNTYLEAVKIFFDETGGVEGRGGFYDHYGALRDVMQNHVLQILAMVTMDSPTSLDSEAIRDKKAEILHAVRIVNGVLGQYEGYLDEPGVKPASQTETYAALKLFIDHPRWYGVPFYLETGKKMARKTTEVQLILKPVDHCPWSDDGICTANMLTIRINPQEGISLQVNTKKPGSTHHTTTVNLNFTYAATFGPISSQAYEVILQEIITGQQYSAVRFDEIEYQWDIIEKAYALNLPVCTYPVGSLGPQQGQALMNERSA